MRFQTNECPLCNKVLVLKKTAGVATYSCPAEAKSHYEVELDEKEAIQHMYAFPCAVDNHSGASRSRIYRWKDNRWRFVKEVPHVNPRPVEELRVYLQSLIPMGTPLPTTL